MADGRDPPPFEDEDSQRDEEDIFQDTSENEESTKTRVSVKPDIDSKDLFNDDDEDDGVEINLDDDDEDETPKEKQSPEVSTQSNDIFHSVPVMEPEPPKATEPVPKPAEVAVNGSEEIGAPAAASVTPQLAVTQTSISSVKPQPASRKAKEEEEPVEEDQHTLTIRVTDPYKNGDGIGAYIVYKVMTKTTIPSFRNSDLVVIRRFSDFLGLHEKLVAKYLSEGLIIPPAPEKSVIGMTKVKMSKEDSSSADFVERRRCALERFLNRVAAHPKLKYDPALKEFLEKEGELPKSSSTSALSGAGVMRFFSKVGDAVDKLANKMDETDEWFKEKQVQVDCLDQQFRKLHTSVESLVDHRKELGINTAHFAKSAAMLGNAEEHAALSRCLSQLAETEERIEQIHNEQADIDFYVLSELLKDYIALIGAVKDAFHKRAAVWKAWKDAETTLTKKRENKTKLELANKTDKIAQAKQEIADWEQKVEKGKEEFEQISQIVRREVARFDRCRVEDFKSSIIRYLEQLMENQQKVIKCWEAFMPEAKAIA